MSVIDLPSTTIEDYHRLGYAIVPGALDAGEVAAAREACHARLQSYGREEMLPLDFLGAPEIWGTIFTPTVAAALRGVLGDDACFYPNLTARKSLYIGWHIDEAFAGAGKEYVWEPGFAHLQGAIYLQDNDPETGGGIDVVPGSHLMSVDGYGRVAPDFDAALAALPPDRQPVRVDGRAGDLVLWHARTWHRSTQPETAPLEKEREKLGIFFSAGQRRAFANNRFLSHLVTKQVQRVGGEDVVFGRHAQILDVRYPESFGADVRERLDEIGVGVATYGSF